MNVYVANLQLDSQLVNPASMRVGVRENNLKPVVWSEWRKENSLMFDLFETTLANADVNIVQLSDHNCWEDMC